MTVSTTLRTLLLLDIIAMAGLAAVFLRQRQLTWQQYAGWGLLALLIPLLGPFLVILSRPGRWRPASLPTGAQAFRLPLLRQFELFYPLRKRRITRR